MTELQRGVAEAVLLCEGLGGLMEEGMGVQEVADTWGVCVVREQKSGSKGVAAAVLHGWGIKAVTPKRGTGGRPPRSRIGRIIEEGPTRAVVTSLELQKWGEILHLETLEVRVTDLPPTSTLPAPYSPDQSTFLRHVFQTHFNGPMPTEVFSSQLSEYKAQTLLGIPPHLHPTLQTVLLKVVGPGVVDFPAFVHFYNTVLEERMAAKIQLWWNHLRGIPAAPAPKKVKRKKRASPSPMSPRSPIRSPTSLRSMSPRTPIRSPMSPMSPRSPMSPKSPQSIRSQSSRRRDPHQGTFDRLHSSPIRSASPSPSPSSPQRRTPKGKKSKKVKKAKPPATPPASSSSVQTAPAPVERPPVQIGRFILVEETSKGWLARDAESPLDTPPFVHLDILPASERDTARREASVAHILMLPHGLIHNTFLGHEAVSGDVVVGVRGVHGDVVGSEHVPRHAHDLSRDVCISMISCLLQLYEVGMLYHGSLGVAAFRYKTPPVVLKKAMFLSLYPDTPCEHITESVDDFREVLISSIGPSAVFPVHTLPPPTFVLHEEARCCRAPEVLLASTHLRQSDVWSVGCIAFQLVTGKTLFQPTDEEDHILQIVELVGPPPRRAVVGRMTDYFDDQGRLHEVPLYRRHATLPDLVYYYCPDATGTAHLVNFISTCLQWDPKDRPPLEELLTNPWLAPYVPAHRALASRFR